jgi:hypothetical protein
MADMVFCQECGAEIHRSAPNCPNCGAQLRTGREKNCIFAALLAIFPGGIGLHRTTSSSNSGASR